MDDSDDSDDFGGLVAPDERDDQIPCDGSYRGVPLHAGQSPARIRVVKRDIDRVWATDEVDTLVELSGNIRVAPEARMHAGRKLEALRLLAVEKRWERPRFDRERLKVMVVGLDSKIWRDPHFYGTILDARTRRGVPRERPLGPDD
jgi:hypothetical protein